MNPRQGNPEHQDDTQQGQDDGLQHLNTLSLSDRPHGKGQDRRAAAAKSCRKTNSTDVEVSREQLREGYDGGREQRPDEEALQSHGHCRYDELGNEPEQEL